jgi:hypothetical protein
VAAGGNHEHQPLFCSVTAVSDREQQQQIRESVEHIADRAARKAVEDTLLLIGVDVRNPVTAQEQFASLRRMATLVENEEHAADMAFVRRVRLARDAVVDSSWRTTAKVLITFALGLLAVGSKDWWGSHVANWLNVR